MLKKGVFAGVFMQCVFMRDDTGVTDTIVCVCVVVTDTSVCVCVVVFLYNPSSYLNRNLTFFLQ